MTTLPADVPHTQNIAPLEKQIVLFGTGKHFYSVTSSKTLIFLSLLLDQLTLVTMQF
jgi:hypothetical protein